MGEQNQVEQQKTGQHADELLTTSRSSQIQLVQKENARMKILLSILTIALLGLLAFFVLSQSFSFKIEPKNGERTGESPLPQASNIASPTGSVSPAPMTPQASATPTAKPVIESRIEETDKPNQKKYISKLGVSFLFMKKYGGETFAVKELGNKIYVYPENGFGTYEDGQYIEIFQKDPQDSLVDALKKQFLQGYSEADCIAVDNKILTGGTKPSIPTMVYANITVPGEFVDMDEQFKKIEKCPKRYTMSNGISYFQMDTMFPDRFAFFSIGQYSISSGEDKKGWQDTVEFF